MISASRALIAAVALVLTSTFATLVTAHDHHHDHHHDGFKWNFGLYLYHPQTQQEAFRDCVCWNTTSDNWCHNQDDGHHTGFWRDSCQRVVYVNAVFWVPALLWCVYLCLTPILMCLFRMCCNCCGGRTPSFGCCCPISNKVLSPDPKWVRPYSRCATLTAKSLAIIVFVAFLALSINSYNNTHQLHQVVRNGASTLQSDVNVKVIEIQSIKAHSIKYAQEPWMSFSKDMVGSLESIVPTLTKASKDIGKAPEHVGHHHLSAIYAMTAIPLLVVLIVTVLAMCNIRSWPISISAGILSFIAVVLVIFASAIMSVSLGVNLFCNHQQTITTFTEDVMKSHGYCSQERFTNAINITQIAYSRTLCQDPAFVQMMKGKQTMRSYALLWLFAPSAGEHYAHGFCDEKVGGMYRNNTQEYVNFYVQMLRTMQVVDAQRLRFILSDIQMAATSSGVSIETCAMNTTCPQHTLSLKIYDAVAFIFGEAASLNQLMVLNYDCQIVNQQLQTIVQPIVCATSSSRPSGMEVSPGDNIQSLANDLFGMALVATIAFWVWMNGSKRFTKSASKEELLGHHDAQRQQMAGLRYQEVDAAGVSSPKDTAVVPVSAAVAATTAQPLLLHHSAPTYNNGSVNNRSAQDVDAYPAKQQPHAI